MIDDLSPNFWKGRKKTDCLLLHYTANDSLSDAVSMMRANGTSAHYIVGQGGELRRIVRETNRAWHAGQSAWNGKDQVNHFSIGVEIVNFGWADAVVAGQLRRTQDGGVVSSSAPPASVLDDRPASQGLLWAAYPEAQLAALLPLIKDIVKRNKIDPTQVIGHEHVAPGRKRDPGPAFPWPRVTQALASLPSSHKQVTRAVQSHCARLGFAPADGIDGAWGKNTEAAIARLVARHGPVYHLTPPTNSWTDRRRFAEALRSLPG